MGTPEGKGDEAGARRAPATTDPLRALVAAAEEQGWDALPDLAPVLEAARAVLPARRELFVSTPGSCWNILPLRPADADALIAAGLIYPCGDGHDLHLSPDADWTVDAVARLLTRVIAG